MGKTPNSINPFGGSPLGGVDLSPFGGISPFAPPKETTNNLNSLIGNEKSKPSLDGFDVDELVKKIDAKIAELEEEERQEKAAEEEKKNKIIEDEITNKEDKKLYESGTYGDEFFNDFFSDET